MTTKTGTRALHITAEQLELLRTVVRTRFVQAETHIDNNAALIRSYTADPKFGEGHERTVQFRELWARNLERAAALRNLLQLIDNV